MAMKEAVSADNLKPARRQLSAKAARPHPRAGNAQGRAHQHRRGRERQGPADAGEQQGPLRQHGAKVQLNAHGDARSGRIRRYSGKSPRLRPSHFLAMASSSPLFLASAMISFTLALNLSSPLAMPMKLGLSLSSNLYSAESCGFLVIMLPATEAPRATNCTWPAVNAAMVALLSSKRLVSTPAGATLPSSWSSMAPRVTPTDLPARSAKLLTAIFLGPNTAWKKG